MYKRTICVMGRALDQEDGLGVYSYNLLKTMIRLDKDSAYVILLRSSKNKTLFSDFDNVKTHVIPSKVKYVWDQVHVPIASKKHHADIIFNPKFSLPLLCKTPGVFVLQGSDWYVNPKNYKWWDNIYIRLMMPIFCRKAAGLSSISQCVLDDFVKFANIDSRKVTVNYAAPSPHFRMISDDDFLREKLSEFGLPEKFILTVARAYHTGHGRLPKYPGGNINRLIEGFIRYREAGGKLPLVFAGKNIKEYLLGEGLGKKLEQMLFVGFIPHDDMVYLYNLAHFLILVTLYESFCFPMVEAMASGCPVIVPTTGACPEVAGGSALLVDPLNIDAIAEAMTSLDKSKDLRLQLRSSGVDRAKIFTWENTALLTLKIFDSILRQKKILKTNVQNYSA